MIGGLHPGQMVQKQNRGFACATRPRSAKGLCYDSNVGIPGTVLLERYRIVRPFARGGSSVVYLAFDPHGAPYAVKLYPPHLASRADREYLVGHGLNHPHLNPVLERVTVDGQPGVLVPFAPGERLSDFVAHHGPKRFLEAFTQTLEALAYLHAKGLVHRDLKPENLIVAPGLNSALEVKLIDYDLSGPTGEVFRERVAPGTVGYISPEAARGLPLTPSADLYSAGVLLYWGITGQLPFDGSPQEVVRDHISRPVPHPRDLRDDPFDHPLDGIALRLLAKTPNERYANAPSVLEAIQIALKTRGEALRRS
jgi:eukaryotic-like serine/threonine-protein kinase